MTPATFAFRPRRLDPQTCVLALEGDLDLDCAPRLRRALRQEVATGHERLVVDLSGVTFMDSTALGVLVGVAVSLKPGGIAIVGASTAILKLFQMTGVERTFELFPTVDVALSTLAQRPLHHPERTEEETVKTVDEVTAHTGTTTEELAPTKGASPGARAHLTGDAAVALGIAATAMPFAESAQDQAERWLRILRHYGDAGILLTSLGFANETVDVEYARAGSAADTPTDSAPGEILIDHALRNAKRRGATKVHTSDLLVAAMEVYGEAFDRALAEHGIRSSELIASLDVGDDRSSEDST